MLNQSMHVFFPYARLSSVHPMKLFITQKDHADIFQRLIKGIIFVYKKIESNRRFRFLTKISTSKKSYIYHFSIVSNVNVKQNSFLLVIRVLKRVHPKKSCLQVLRNCWKKIEIEKSRNNFKIKNHVLCKGKISYLLQKFTQYFQSFKLLDYFFRKRFW